MPSFARIGHAAWRKSVKATAPILPIYEARGLVHRVDGMADIAEVGSQIDAILDAKH